MMATGRNMTKNVQLTGQQAKLDVLQGNTGNEDLLEDGELQSDDDEICDAKRLSVSPNENHVVEKLIKTDATVYQNIQAGTSARMDDEGMECDGPMKDKYAKAEYQPKKNDEVKKPIAVESYDASSSSHSSSPKEEKTTPPYQHVSSLWGDYKIPKKGSSNASTSESRAYSASQPISTSSSSLLEKCFEDYYASSSVPKSRPYYSPQPSSTFKSQVNSIKSSSTTRKLSVSPRPITGGKTIRMAPSRATTQRLKSCKSKTSPNGFPRCELLTDNGIKMIIRFPKKV